MIVLSVGMPRAGSGWHYRLIHDLVVASGGRDAREIRRRYRLERLLTEVNCNIGALSAKRLLPVMAPALLGNTFAIKAHAPPRPLARFLMRIGLIRPTYIYRDPRAALLSVYEYGQQGIEMGKVNAFSHLTTFKEALDFMLDYVGIWEQWMALDRALHVRYEDLLADYETQARRLISFLGVEDKERSGGVARVIEKYRPGQADRRDEGLHFHKGQPERFRQALSAERLEISNRAFGPYLERMGYTL